MTTHDWFAMHPTDVHQKAAAFANAACPEFKDIDTPEHAQWLRWYDVAFFRLMMGDMK